MVFYNPAYPALSRTLKRARAREVNTSRKRRKTMAATTIQRAYRRANLYSVRARAATGESTVAIPARIHTQKTDGFVAHDTNDLAVYNILNIERASLTNQDLDTRSSDVIYLSGFKVDMCVKNNLANDNSNSLYFNVAVISTKARSSTSFTDDLFTSGVGTSRAYDFDNVNYTSFDRHTDPINSDNYVVHWHRRMIITPNQQAAPGDATHTWPYFTFLSQYVPVKRQIRFDSATSTGSEPGFRIIYWCGKIGEAASNPIVNTADAIKVEYNIRTYFRDVM